MYARVAAFGFLSDVTMQWGGNTGWRRVGLLHPPPVCPPGAPLIPLKAAGRPFSLHVEAKKLKQVFNSEGPTVWTKVMMMMTLHTQKLFSSSCRASTASVCVCSGFSQMEIVSHHVKV